MEHVSTGSLHKMIVRQVLTGGDIVFSKILLNVNTGVGQFMRDCLKK